MHRLNSESLLCRTEGMKQNELGLNYVENVFAEPDLRIFEFEFSFASSNGPGHHWVGRKATPCERGCSVCA